MMLRVPDVLPAPVVSRVRSIIESGDWSDGRGMPGGGEKGNWQLAEDGKAARAARAMVLDSLGQNALFFTAALPKKIFPPLFNRYDGRNNRCASHIDSAVRTWVPTGAQVRCDLAATLFLSDPREYDGGELVIEDSHGTQSFKLKAGELLLYPPSLLHRVEPVTRGIRLGCYFWIESMVLSEEQRRLLYELDMTIYALRGKTGDSAELTRLTGCYHNLLRMWGSS